jgi:PAS domain S-box-containing protein
MPSKPIPKAEAWPVALTVLSLGVIVLGVATGWPMLRTEMAALVLASAVFGAIAGLVLLRGARREAERRIAVEELRKESALRAAIIQRATEGLCVCHPIAEHPFVRFTVWNDRMTEITGYTLEEINRLGWYQTVYPDPESSARARERMERMRAGEDLLAEEWEIKHASGQTRVLLISTTLLEDREGGGQVLALMNDITDRRRADAARRESEERLRATLDNTPGVAVQWFDRDGRVLYWNPASEKLYGFSAAQALGKTLDQLIQTPEQTEAFRRVLEEIDRTRKPFGPAEAVVKRRDGSEGQVLYTTFAIPGPGDAPMFVCMDVDITDWKRAKDALRRSEERFHVYMDNSPMIAFYKDADGRMLYVNRAMQESFRIFQGRDWVGKTDHELWPAEIADELRRNDVRILETGRSEALEERVWQNDAWHSWLVHKFRFVDSAGNRFLGGLGIDLTDRKRLEEQLLHAQKMESIGRLAGGVAHDFNNVLTAIIGSVELAEARVEPRHAVQGELTQIRSAAERAADLTRQLLTFARRQIIEPRDVDLNAIIAGVEPMLRRLIGENVRLTIRATADLGSVRADRGQIEQVLMNLSVNARDAMPHGGTLTLATANVDVPAAGDDSEPPPGRYVRLEASDDGVGMDETVRARIFEPFFTTKGIGAGTGLGLATVYGIVRQSDGFITVSSSPGQGTSFRIYLPRSESTPAAETLRPTGETRRGTETILLVEDEPMVRGIAVASLRSAGYTVLAACDGEQALRIATAHEGEIQLLLSDVVLPRMSGPQLASRLTESRPGMGLLFVSGYTDDTIVRHGVLEHGVNLLHKPYTPAGLTQKVREVLDATRPMTAPVCFHRRTH